MFFGVVVLDLTLMTTTFGARIFRRAGKSHVGRGVAYTDASMLEAHSEPILHIYWSKTIKISQNAVFLRPIAAHIVVSDYAYTDAAKFQRSKWGGHLEERILSEIESRERKVGKVAGFEKRKL